MPLMRMEVRNEYGLGAPEMYIEANNDEPKEILQGVAVAGLVGLLRQLGDIADFAAEVFHGLQEEVMITCSRSYKLMGRVQRIEAALVSLEKAVLAQRSHLQFAYTAGVNWHAPARCEKNHFVYSDMPLFILDSYEDCRSPPHFHLLDRFDPGGPGSCLKRYSDPTIFSNASEAFGDASTQKVTRDMKVQKNKKRRSWPRNGEVSRGASFAYYSARMQFPQSDVGGHTSPRQPISTYYAASRSDLYEQSHCSEDNISPSYSMQPKKQESRGFISSPKKSHGSDGQDHNFLKEKVIDACDDIQINLTQEQGVCSSHSEPAMEDYDHDTNLESCIPRLDLETLGNEAFNYETVDRLGVQARNQSLQTLGSGAIHLNDFESEIDYFMDAPNIIKPDSETDTNCMRKQNIDHFSKLEDNTAADGLPEHINQNLKSQASVFESNVLADSSFVKADCGHKPVVVFPESCSPGCYSSGRVPAKDEYNSVSADKSFLSSQMTRHSLNRSSKKNISYSGNGGSTDSAKKESISCSVSSNFRDNGSGMSIIGDIKSSHEPEKPVSETSDITSVTFWTNGGLLGLQPSKPLLCGVLNDLPQYCLSKEDGKSSSSAQHVICRDRDQWKPDETNRFRNVEECLDMDCSICQEYQESDESLREKFWKRGNLLYPHDANSTGASVSASEGFLSADSEFQAARKHPEIAGSSSLKFELSRKLLSTLFYEKELHGGEENSSPASYLNANAFEQKKHQNFAYLSEGGSLMQSPPSSPPLAHMKISVQPIGGFKNSKLKLKFMDGGIIDRGSIDTFPSFQLVPEVSNTRLNVFGSDSDDDTFCRSSDGFHDHHSESNYEQWESGRPPGSEDPDLYDTLCRISLAENSCDVDLKHSSSSSSQQHKAVPINDDHANEQKSKALSSEKSNAEKEAKQDKKIDENNFLNQIRSKSLSLRPTVPGKPIVPSSSSTNVQIMTILEKANAIRQAVGSDDGDNWSDT